MGGFVSQFCSCSGLRIRTSCGEDLALCFQWLQLQKGFRRLLVIQTYSLGMFVRLDSLFQISVLISLGFILATAGKVVNI